MPIFMQIHIFRNIIKQIEFLVKNYLSVEYYI